MTEEPDTITESVKFYWTPRNYVYDWAQLLFYIAGGTFFFYCLWTYYFAGQCIVCNRKMAFLSKHKDTTDLCLICRCLGAEMPHPEIVARLRREKAAQQNNQNLMRRVFKDIRTNVLKVLGIHQVVVSSWLVFVMVGGWWWTVVECGDIGGGLW